MAVRDFWIALLCIGLIGIWSFQTWLNCYSRWSIRGQRRAKLREINERREIEWLRRTAEAPDPSPKRRRAAGPS
jgi:hypothetical protein